MSAPAVSDRPEPVTDVPFDRTFFANEEEFMRLASARMGGDWLAGTPHADRRKWRPA